MPKAMLGRPRCARELRDSAKHCRCHEPAMGHYWDAKTLHCTNAGCTRTWEGQQLRPTRCQHRRKAPWEGQDPSGASGARAADGDRVSDDR